MKEINTFQLVKVPEGIEASVKSRAVTVKGPRGSLTKAFKHLAVDIYKVDKDTIKVEKWFGKKKELAAVRTVCSHIENLFKGVMKVGFDLKIRNLTRYIGFLYIIIEVRFVSSSQSRLE